MFSAVLCVVFAQTQPVKLVVVEGSNLGVPEARAAELTRSVVELARLEGFDAAAVQPDCPAQQCYLEAARGNGADAVISVGFAALGRDAVMDLDCRASASGEPLAQMTLTIRATTQADLVFEHLPFLRQVKRALTAPEPPKVVEKPCPAPPPQPPPAPVVIEAPRPASRLPYVTGALGLAAAVAGGVLLAVNGTELQHLQAVVHNGVTPNQHVPSAVAYDERLWLGTGLLIGAGVALALTLVIALIQ